MTKNPKILSIVLAGGEGTRLMPLTRDRAKPAVPFGGVYRLIDFPLSNLVNSGYRQVVVLTQYKSHSLDRHISQVWRFSPLLGSYVSPVPAQQRLGKHWYLGSADAIYQTINIIEDVQPDIVVIVGADHVYRMDFEQMVQQHIESGAEFTVAGIRQPIEESNQFGAIEVDPDHPNMIKNFQEKPPTTTGLPVTTSPTPRPCSRLWLSMRRLPTPSTTWAATSPRTSLPATKPASTTSTRTRFRAPRPLITLTGATSVRLSSSTMRTWI